MATLDPITGNDPSSLTVAQLAERVAMERALREQEYRALREALAAIKDMVLAKDTTDERALKLQAAEYERRLETLNHAHQQAIEAQARTVPRELFDQYVKETSDREDALSMAQNDKMTARLSAINARIDVLDNWRSGLEGRVIGIMAVIGVLVVIVNLAIRLL